MLRALQKKFGQLAGAQSGYDCLKNAIHNTSLAIASGMRSQILFVNLRKQRLGSHAYLTNGQDVTTMVFWQALQIFGAEDKHRHHIVIDRLAREVPWVVDTVHRLYEG